MLYRRVQRPGASVFLTLVTHRRQPLLTNNHNIQRLRKAFQHELTNYPFSIDAIVILPDHLHTVWSLPAGDHDYQNRVSRIKRYFSTDCRGFTANQSATRASRRLRPVWQQRYWEHTIRDQHDWQKHIDYIHYNPVRHGYSTCPGEWEFSSFARCVAKGWYSSDWGKSEPGTVTGVDLE